MLYVVINMALALVVDNYNSGMHDHRHNLDSNTVGWGGNNFFLEQQSPVDQGLLIHEVSRSHTTHHSR